MCRSKRNEIDLRYPNEATAPQIAAQSPSDNSRITISDAPLFSGTSAVRTNRSDRDGPAVMWRLLRWAWHSATSASRCRFRETGLAGVRLNPSAMRVPPRVCGHGEICVAIMRQTGMRHCCSAQALWQKRDPADAGRRCSQCRARKAVAAAGSADTRRRVIWRRHPVVTIETQPNNLRRLKALYIDCGEKDQFNLLYGVRRFVRRLNELGIAHCLRGVRRQPVSIAGWTRACLFSPRRCSADLYA